MRRTAARGADGNPHGPEPGSAISRLAIPRAAPHPLSAMVSASLVPVLLRAHYGVDFAAAVGRGHVAGVQFHPEKSHRYGKALLARFAGVELEAAA